ncbi:hypothetical protein mflW37_5840 [Mesoplasma florum W37]|uniref:Uncharacterized protein n=1 Tax=Mesoplasma florum TaxID=2151 RepID=A0AAD0HSB9_MESFO|nr:hypothetical protein [Mesoplasma florum]AGY41651.1 hypothetical protein mflW37_5840 [Mesoplasma florum W37]AVN59855.1 hypothetical protein CG008_03090 [Mesoplasma florum]AVN65989.1 hypothetical protein MflW12_5840 [Mesoplasma florum]
MKFKEYYKKITGETEYSIIGLRIFIYLSNKTLDKLANEILKKQIEHGTWINSNPVEMFANEIKRQIGEFYLENQIALKMKKDLLNVINIAVQELLKLDNGVLELEDLLGKELFNELYTEEKFKC